MYIDKELTNYTINHTTHDIKKYIKNYIRNQTTNHTYHTTNHTTNHTYHTTNHTAYQQESFILNSMIIYIIIGIIIIYSFSKIIKNKHNNYINKLWILPYYKNDYVYKYYP